MRRIRGRQRPTTISDEGLTVPASGGSFDVFFGDRHVWSFSRGAGAEPRLVSWPRAMRPYLSGTTQVRVTQGSRCVLDQTHRFGDGAGEVRFVDGEGIPLMVDKWGLLQRPFSGRDPAVVTQMLDVTEDILRCLEEDCGLQGWLGFGSLLGAAREGGVIGHDSDVDLAYLSRCVTPAAMMREMYAVLRALRARGMRVERKSGTFLTVLFTAPDGGIGSVDLYTCFYVGPTLYETATVREEVPREAIEPLRAIRFEGRDLPAPADVDRMLEVSYGRGWRTPDPSFSHRPGPDATVRFHQWFGNAWHHRRDWERQHRSRPKPGANSVPGSLGERALRELRSMPAGATLVDVGCGAGFDVLAAARHGFTAVGMDYARGVLTPARKLARQEQLPAHFLPVNVYDRRDALSAAALVTRLAPGPRLVTVGGVLGSLLPMDRENVFDLVALLLRRGGTSIWEFSLEGGAGVGAGVRRFALTPHLVSSALTRRGGQVVDLRPVRHRAPAVDPPADPEQQIPDAGDFRRMTVIWPDPDHRDRIRTVRAAATPEGTA